jgi:membrane protein implicated in regulation of membrane protease activity
MSEGASRTGTSESKGPWGFVRDNALGLFFTASFLLTLAGQAIAGQADLNHQLVADRLQPVGFTEFVTSSDFAVDVAENWQSEYLQFSLYIGATVWLLQRGSPESKEPGKSGPESDEEQLVGEHARENSPKWAAAPGWRRTVYSNSLLLVMGTIFLLSWLVQSITGVVAHNEEQLRQLEAPVGWTEYLSAPDFWNRTLQNWQSELLAVASMAVLSIYLRQRGSPESKPVGSAHSATGVEG